MLSFLLTVMLVQMPDDGVIHTGQSNDEGNDSPVLDVTNPSASYRFAGYSPCQTVAPYLTAAQIEPTCTEVVACGGTTHESPVTSSFTQLNVLTGRAYFNIYYPRGGYTFAQLMGSGIIGEFNWPITWFYSQLDAWGTQAAHSRCVVALTVHGEADESASATEAAYEANMVTWQALHQTACRNRSKSGQDQIVPQVHFQVSAWTGLGVPTPPGANGGVVEAQRLAPHNNPNIYLAAPGYPRLYVDAQHFTKEGAQASGYQLAIAAYTVMAVRDGGRGGIWRPLEPLGTPARSTSHVVADFNVPCVFDGTCSGTWLSLDGAYGVAGNFITDPGTAKGFEYVGANITSVQLCTDVDTPVVGCFAQTTCAGAGSPRSTCEFAGQGIAGVAINLDASASGTLRYAWTGVAGHNPGATTGARGLLHDESTRFVPANNWRLFNHSVHFSMAVP